MGGLFWGDNGVENGIFPPGVGKGDSRPRVVAVAGGGALGVFWGQKRGNWWLGVKRGA